MKMMCFLTRYSVTARLLRSCALLRQRLPDVSGPEPPDQLGGLLLLIFGRHFGLIVSFLETIIAEPGMVSSPDVPG